MDNNSSNINNGLDTQHTEPDSSLIHKLRVQNNDKTIQNLLCPIELLSQSTNYSAPLIPKSYDSRMFSGFENVSPNSFKASTPKLIRKKRKNNKNNIPKRKKMKLMNNMHKNLHGFSFQPHLMINSRPKRQIKKVSYKEMDSNDICTTHWQNSPQSKKVKCVRCSNWSLSNEICLCQKSLF
eukprot:159423_1